MKRMLLKWEECCWNEKNVAELSRTLLKSKECCWKICNFLLKLRHYQIIESSPKWTVLKVNGRAKVDGAFKSGRSLVKLDGHLSQSGRSKKIVDGFLTQSGRSWVEDFDSKWTVIRLNESNDKSGPYKYVKVDGSSILKSESGRFQNFKLHGLKVWK